MKLDTTMAMTNYHTAQFEQNSKIKKIQLDKNTEDAQLKEQTDNFEALLLKIMLQDAIKNDDTLYPKQSHLDGQGDLGDMGVLEDLWGQVRAAVANQSIRHLRNHLK